MAHHITDKSSVKATILFDVAISNLVNKKLRTALTVFGIAIGIGAIFFLLSFGIGMQRLVTDEVIGNQTIKSIDVSSSNSQLLKIDDISVDRISKIPNVEQVGRAYYFPGSYKINSSESDSIIYGVDKGYQDLTYLNLVEGRLLEQQDKLSVILNIAALESIGLADNPGELVNKIVEITVPLAKADKQLQPIKNDFTVVGIIDSGSGAELFIPANNFDDAGVAELTQLKAGAVTVDDVRGIRTQIESLGLQTASPVDTIDQINQVFRFFNIILIGFGSIGMIVAVLGMFNTLTISLLERTKEIGLMVALGARSIDMRKLFMFEAMILSFSGALIGIIGAFLLGRIVNLGMNMLADGRGVQNSFELFAYPPIIVFGMLVFMVIVGLIVVYIPAKRAEKINPIDSLRRE